MRYKLIPFFALVSRAVGKKVGDKLAQSMGFLTWILCGKIRSITIKNLSMITEKNIKIKSLRLVMNFFIILKDFFDILWKSPDEIIKDVELFGKRNLEDALKNYKKAILVTYHMGNYELAAIYLSLLGFPITTLVEKVEEEHYQIYKKLRTRFNTEIINVNEVPKILHALKKNRVLATLCDRDITENGVILDFFKGKRSIPLGPAYLSIRMKIPVLTGYFVLGGKKRYIGFIDKKIDFTPSGNLKKDVKELTEKIKNKLNQYLSLFHEQWFVFQDEWVS